MECLMEAPMCNSTVSGLLQSTLAASSASSAASHSHLTGFVQLAVLALLAFPIWLFGLLIGLFLPRGTFAVSNSQLTDVSSVTGSRSSSLSLQGTDVPGISSRPLSDDELASSESDNDDDSEIIIGVLPVHPHSKGKYSTNEDDEPRLGFAQSGAQRSSKAVASSSSGKVANRLRWAKKTPLAGWQQQVARYLSPSGPSTPDAVHYKRISQEDEDIQDDNIHLVIDHQQQQDSQKSAASSLGHHALSTSVGDPVPGLQYNTFGASSVTDRSRGMPVPQPVAGHHWLVTEDDLDRFVSTIKPVEDKMLTGNIGPDWNLIMDKEVPGVVRYLSYWRPTDSGSTDYLSVTLIPDATAQEIHEFNLDDACRVSWDPMLAKAWLLASRDTTSTEQLVLWLRSFPMGFLSDRLYAGIARKTFKDTERPGSALYGVTKVAKTPAATAWAAEHYPGVIQTDNYFSAWRCRTIPSPWPADESPAPAAEVTGDSHLPKLTVRTGMEDDGVGAISSSKPACELILFHHDELKVPEYLSRLAIKVGMWKFVTGMVDAAGTWLEKRRARCDPYQDDPAAAGRQTAPPLTGAAAAASNVVPESPFSPLANQSLGVVDGQHQTLDTDQLLTPRRLYAVPTAPNLLSLSVDEEGASTPPMPTNRPQSASAARGLSPLGQIAAPESRGLRRGHSLEWEPIAEQLPELIVNRRSEAVQADVTGVVNVEQQSVSEHCPAVPVQQRRFSWLLSPQRVGLQALTACGNIPGVANAVSWVQGLGRELGRRLQRNHPIAAAAAGSFEEGEGSQRLQKTPEITQFIDPAAAVTQSTAQGGAKVYASTTDWISGDDVGSAATRDQRDRAGQSGSLGQLQAGVAHHRKQGVQRLFAHVGSSSSMCQFVVRGAAVLVAVSVTKVLLTSNRRHRGVSAAK